MNHITAKEIIDLYQLAPHPEGGYYSETYRSTGEIDGSLLTPQLNGKRSYSTAIYFLLEKGQKSQLHRLQFDEIFHFYLGEPLSVWILYPDHRFEKITMGQDILSGQQMQLVIPANSWFGAIPDGNYSFIGCTLAPGFDFVDFELKDPKLLMDDYPSAREMISQFIN